MHGSAIRRILAVMSARPRTSARAPTAALLCFGLAACAAGGDAPERAARTAPEAQAEVGLDFAGWTAIASVDPSRSVLWRLVAGGTVPRNQEFELDVLVLHDGAPHAVDRLEVGGWMPDHNHGFVQIPSVRELAPGRYRVEGLLLHMRGTWQVRLVLFEGERNETVVIELEL